jgi:hypothetical protein
MNPLINPIDVFGLNLIIIKAFKIKKPPRINTVPQRLGYQHLLQRLFTVASKTLRIKDGFIYKTTKI